MSRPMQEIDEKVERVARLATARGLSGILLNSQPNFAWLSGGRSNRIDGSRENGSGSLLVSARGERFVIANNIEMPRLGDEALSGLGFTPREHAWVDEQAHPGHAVRSAQDTVGGSVGCDLALPGAVPIEGPIAALRAPLTDSEATRYRALGADLGRVVGETCRALVPGLSELEIAQQVSAAAATISARAIVTLVAADDRIARYRHPSPTSTRWRKSVMVVVCAQREGLVAALSRIVVAGPVPDELRRRTIAATKVFERLLIATTPGTSGAQLFSVAASAYADAGFAGEELRHHQGGATGYRSREWIAHPASSETVQACQAFAWNPSITGSKVEETVLVGPAGLEMLTSSPHWPSISICVHGRELSAPDVLVL